jgi:hypothetical protein
MEKAKAEAKERGVVINTDVDVDVGVCVHLNVIFATNHGMFGERAVF